MKKPLLILFTLLACGCAPRSIESYHTAESEEEVTRLLNERAYQKAIFLVESKHGKTPADKNIAFLLGQAYLGKMGFEPLLVASRVSDAQDFSSPEARLLFPGCQTGRLREVKGAEALCLLKRIYLHVPDADLHEFTRARDLFRHAYPVASESPEWVNVLIGMVETASVVKRAGGIYVFVLGLQNGRQMPSDAELAWVARQIRRVVAESGQALQRADHSGKKISQLLTGTRETELFQKAKMAVKWADTLGLGALFDIFRHNMASPEHEAQFGPVLDKIRVLLDEQALAVKKLNGT